MKSLSYLLLTYVCMGCNVQEVTKPSGNGHSSIQIPEYMENTDGGISRAYFASGCFWCVEEIYESIAGVTGAVSGFSGGTEKDPTYATIGKTSHAETVEVMYDSTQISYKQLVKAYFLSQNPTQVNGQGPDHGINYRSIVFYSNETEKGIAQAYKDSLNNSGNYSSPIAANIQPFEVFYPASGKHQNFVKRNPNQSYVQSVSVPRLNRFLEKWNR